MVLGLEGLMFTVRNPEERLQVPPAAADYFSNPEEDLMFSRSSDF